MNNASLHTTVSPINTVVIAQQKWTEVHSEKGITIYSNGKSLLRIHSTVSRLIMSLDDEYSFLDVDPDGYTMVNSNARDLTFAYANRVKPAADHICQMPQSTKYAPDTVEGERKAIAAWFDKTRAEYPDFKFIPFYVHNSSAVRTNPYVD